LVFKMLVDELAFMQDDGDHELFVVGSKNESRVRGRAICGPVTALRLNFE
jgi:hypothetical protein